MKRTILITGLVLVFAIIAFADLNSLVKEYRNAGSMSDRANALRKFGTEKPRGAEIFLGREFQALEDDKDGGYLRAVIIEALGQLGTSKAGITLVEITYAAEENQRDIIKSALERMEKSLPAIARGAFALKGKTSADGKALLLKVIVKTKAAKRLVPILEKALKDKSAKVRKAALEALELIDAPRALSAIAKLIRDDDTEVAETALDIIAANPHPENVRRELIAGLKSGSETIVTRCLHILSGMADKNLAKDVLPLAKSSNEEIRTYVAAIIGASEDPGFIDRLISMLSAAKEDKEKLYVASVLAVLSGEDFGTDIAEWKKWWEGAKADFRYRPVDIATYSGRGGLSFFGTSIDSDKIIFIIDTSQSMSEMYFKQSEKKEGAVARTTPDTEDLDKMSGKVRKIDVAKKELVRCIKSLTRDIRYNIFRFSTAVSPWKTAIQKASRASKADSIEFVNKWDPVGLTNLYGVIEAALTDKEVNTLYILSDGEPTTGAYGKGVDPDTFVNAVMDLIEKRGEKVRIHAFGFGLRGRGRAILVNLAERTGGTFRDL
ncbi:MAG: HEAT repeat domain-containing protein [Planctomycetota bacterium]|jgi:HEAT repeat protein